MPIPPCVKTAWFPWLIFMRSNRNYRFNGEIQCISALAEKYKINRGTLCYRLFVLKWSLKKALTTPVKHRRRKK